MIPRRGTKYREPWMDALMATLHLGALRISHHVLLRTTVIDGIRYYRLHTVNKYDNTTYWVFDSDIHYVLQKAVDKLL
jgi:hypothetical protein